MRCAHLKKVSRYSSSGKQCKPRRKIEACQYGGRFCAMMSSFITPDCQSGGQVADGATLFQSAHLWSIVLEGYPLSMWTMCTSIRFADSKIYSAFRAFLMTWDTSLAVFVSMS